MAGSSRVDRIDWTEFDARPVDEEYRPFPDLGRRNLYQERIEVPVMARALGLPDGRRVLEVGCGRGVAIPPLLQCLRPRRLVGLDVDPGLLVRAGGTLRRRDGDVELRKGDVRQLPFPDASFDLVIDFGTCYHVGRRAQALREIVRVLSPGGLFVYETRLNQLLSHPVRSRGRWLPWQAVPELVPSRNALLWASRVKVASR
jgi:ubiquinone/menaquinone biosynthesis C-methylase UbiE